MRVILGGVQVKIIQQLPAQSVLRQHTAHRSTQCKCRLPAQCIKETHALNPAGVPGVTVVYLTFPFIPGDIKFIGVDNDDMLVVIPKRSIGHQVLAEQHKRNLRRKPA